MLRAGALNLRKRVIPPQKSSNIRDLCSKQTGSGENEKTGGAGENEKRGAAGENEKTGGAGENEKRGAAGENEKTGGFFSWGDKIRQIRQRVNEWSKTGAVRSLDGKVVAKLDGDGVQVSFTDKAIAIGTRWWYGEEGLSAVAKVGLGKSEAILQHNVERKSVFDEVGGEVAILVANSNFKKNEHITVVELTGGLYYFIPFAGIPKEKVSFEIKDRWLRISGNAPVEKPGGTKEIVAEMLLPAPKKEVFTREDFMIRWYHNEFVIRVMNYKYPLEKWGVDGNKQGSGLGGSGLDGDLTMEKDLGGSELDDDDVLKEKDFFHNN